MPSPAPTPFDIIEPHQLPMEIPLSVWLLASASMLLLSLLTYWIVTRRDRGVPQFLEVPALIIELRKVLDEFEATGRRELIHLFVKLVQREQLILSEEAKELLVQLEKNRFSEKSSVEAEFPMREILSILSTQGGIQGEAKA